MATKPDPATDGAQKEIIGLINSYQDTIQTQADEMESLESRVTALEERLDEVESQ